MYMCRRSDARVARRLTPQTAEDFWRDGSEEVANVDPDDLRAVLKVMRDTSNKLGGAQTLIDCRLFEHVCSPGVNVEAAWFRASLLGIMTRCRPDGRNVAT